MDVTVKSDIELELTSLIESWSTQRAMKSGSRMIIESILVGCSKSNGIVERAIQSVQGEERLMSQSKENQRRCEACRSQWESCGKGDVQEIRCPRWRTACMWEYRNGVWLTRTVQREDSDRKMGTKQLGDDRGGSVAQERRRCQDGWRAFRRRSRDEDYKEKQEMAEHVPEPKRVYITRGDLEARCPRWCESFHKGTARQVRTENCRRRVEEELRGIVKAEAPQRRVKEHEDKAAERGTKRTKSSLEEGQTDAPTTTEVGVRGFHARE